MSSETAVDMFDPKALQLHAEELRTIADEYSCWPKVAAELQSRARWYDQLAQQALRRVKKSRIAEKQAAITALDPAEEAESVNREAPCDRAVPL